MNMSPATDANVLLPSLDPKTGPSPAPDWRITSLHSRFVYPLQFDARALAEAVKTLEGQTVTNRKGKTSRIWTRATPHAFYRDELLPHVAGFLFPDSSPATPGSAYFKIADELVQAWLHGTTIALARDTRIGMDTVGGVGIELFLWPQGVGALSIALRPTKEGLSGDEAKEINYKIAQYRRRPPCRFRKPHPKDEPAQWARLSPEAQAAVGDTPREDEPLDSRLGVAGGSFTLLELIGMLLKPLEAFGQPAVRTEGEELLVYTVAQFGPEVDLARAEVRTALAPLLAGLAQVEEPGHPGSTPDELGLACGVLNTHHWAAVGLMGAAHLLSDQEGDVAFNQQRVPIVFSKYFIPYLVALLQRKVLNCAIEEAGQIITQKGRDFEQRRGSLRTNLLAFGVGGHFTQLSVRQVLHRYYQIVREGLDVPDAWDEVRRAIADLDAQASADREDRRLQNATRDLNVISRVQKLLHLIEYFVVSVYHAHLWHMFAADNEPLKQWATDSLGINGDWFVSLGVIIFAGIGLGVAWLINFILKRQARKRDLPRSGAPRPAGSLAISSIHESNACI